MPARWTPTCGTSWAIILHLQITGDLDFLVQHWRGIELAMYWLEYQDMNECGLLEVPEAGDWMDLLAVRYNVLYDNVLYYAATLAYEEMARRLPPESTCHTPDVGAAGIHERINLLMWIDRCWVAEHFAEHLEKLKAIRLEWYMVYHNVGHHLQPALLPALGGVPRVRRLVRQPGQSAGHPDRRGRPPPRRAHPALHAPGRHGRAVPHQGDPPTHLSQRGQLARVLPQPQPESAAPVPQRRHLADDRRACTSPRWCVTAGRCRREQMLASLADANRQGVYGDWEFNEWMHGESGHPMGFSQQAWSAATYLYAEHAVRTGKLPLFDDLLAAKPAAARAGEVNEVYDHPGGGPE